MQAPQFDAFKKVLEDHVEHLHQLFKEFSQKTVFVEASAAEECHTSVATPVAALEVEEESRKALAISSPSTQQTANAYHCLREAQHLVLRRHNGQDAEKPLKVLRHNPKLQFGQHPKSMPFFSSSL